MAVTTVERRCAWLRHDPSSAYGTAYPIAAAATVSGGHDRRFPNQAVDAIVTTHLWRMLIKSGARQCAPATDNIMCIGLSVRTNKQEPDPSDTHLILRVSLDTTGSLYQTDHKSMLTFVHGFVQDNVSHPVVSRLMGRLELLGYTVFDGTKHPVPHVPVWIVPTTVVALNTLVLDAHDTDAYNFAQSDPTRFTNIVTKNQPICRIGCTLNIRLDTDSGYMRNIKFRIVFSDPTHQGIVTSTTSIIVTRFASHNIDTHVPSVIALDPCIPSPISDGFRIEVDINPQGNLTIIGETIHNIRVLPLHLIQSISPDSYSINTNKVWIPVYMMDCMGIHHTDYVYLKSKSGYRRLVQVNAIVSNTTITDMIPYPVIYTTPGMIRNVFQRTMMSCDGEYGSIDMIVPGTPITIDSIPVATCVTISRIKSPITNMKSGLTESVLRMMIELRDPIMVTKGDWIGIHVDEISAKIRSMVYPSYEAIRNDCTVWSCLNDVYCWFEITDLRCTESDTHMMILDHTQTRVLESGSIHAYTMYSDVYDVPSTTVSGDWIRYTKSYQELCDVCTVCVESGTESIIPTVLVNGSPGTGKTSLVTRIAKQYGMHMVTGHCHNTVTESSIRIKAILETWIDQALDCAPSILVLDNIDVLCRSVTGFGIQSMSDTDTGDAKPVLQGMLDRIRDGCRRVGYPVMVIGTVCDMDTIHVSVQRLFMYTVSCRAMTSDERRVMTESIVRGDGSVYTNIDVQKIVMQTSGLNVRTLDTLVAGSGIYAMSRMMMDSMTHNVYSSTSLDMSCSGAMLTYSDLDHAVNKTRSMYSDLIGAPKIPNVQWQDIGGLTHVKDTILETIQLPMIHPDLFRSGVKKRSGILLYGPPGTGKTMIAKAVATTLSLNFFSVKGPELLNMYIGESESNVRRVFERARECAPCIVFFDELDSVAPKRGNTSDAGGVMDRIVSQLLSELDGMSSTECETSGDVFVIGATNRPDLLDPALLRPGRFDKLLYLGISTTSLTRLNILMAITRKFNCSSDLDLQSVAEKCPRNCTGADLYAICCDALTRAMTRTIHRIQSLENTGDIVGDDGVVVTQLDFDEAVTEFVPSVSMDELKRYEMLREQFEGMQKQ